MLDVAYQIGITDKNRSRRSVDALVWGASGHMLGIRYAGIWDAWYVHIIWPYLGATGSPGSLAAQSSLQVKRNMSGRRAL